MNLNIIKMVEYYSTFYEIWFNMDEDITAINTTTRNEKIKNFFVKNKKKLTISLSLIILLILSYFVYGEFDKRSKINIANKYNNLVINFITGDKLNMQMHQLKRLKLCAG